MGATSASLGSLLCTQADINYYTQQLSLWNAKYEGNLSKLEQQVKYETQWVSAYDKAMDESRTSALKYDACGLSGTIGKEQAAASEAIAEAYAYTKVDEYNIELSMELADLDIEYDTMKCMYETLLTELQAKEDSEKTLVQQNAQDTGLLNAG